MMESLPPTHHEEPLSPSLPHVYSAVKIEPTTDFWNPPLVHPASGVSENIPTYTSLEPVYPESSYAPSSTQYFPVSSTSNTIQPLYSSCSMMQDEPLLHSALYRDPDLSQTARDEGLGSSPSSFSSTTPPLPQNQSITNGHIVGLSRQSSNADFSHRSTSSTPESTVSSNYSTCQECSNCGNRNDVFWVSTHYLCRQCLPERATTIVQQPLSGDSSGNKRKRSMTTNKNANNVCTNCEATYSKLWRRSISSGETVCNACGLYEKLHHVARPKHMRKDTIQSRKRKPKASQASKVKSSSRKSSKKPKTESNLSPQYMPNEAYDISNYTLPTYNTLQMRDFSSSVNNNAIHTMLPPINSSQPFYARYRPEMYNIYNSVPPNEIINIPHGLPSNIHYASS